MEKQYLCNYPGWNARNDTMRFEMDWSPFKINPYEDAKKYSMRIKPPDIVDVNIIVPDKVVMVSFADGTKEKSVCSDSDVFSLETAIAICIGKRIMGGSGTFNKTVKQGMKVYESKLKDEVAYWEEEVRLLTKRKKNLERKKKRLEKYAEEELKRENEEREHQIEMYKEAYIRAMNSIRENELHDSDKNQ